MAINAHIDGASWSKDKEGIGIVFELPSCFVHIKERLNVPRDRRKQDNNRGEYLALLRALRYALLNNWRDVIILSDSEIVVRQITGKYTCHSNLLPYYVACDFLISWFDSFKIELIPRSKNHEANKLAQQALRAK